MGRSLVLRLFAALLTVAPVFRTKVAALRKKDPIYQALGPILFGVTSSVAFNGFYLRLVKCYLVVKGQKPTIADCAEKEVAA